MVFGEVLFDVFDGEVEALGGAPFNVAWHLQGFGAEPLFVGARGDDARGERIAAAFDRHGLDRSGLLVTPDRPTGVVHAHVDGGDVDYDIVEDVAWDHVDPDAARAAVEGVEVSILVHGSLALRSERTRSAFEAVRDAVDAPVFCDVNLRPPHTPIDRVRALVEGAAYVKVNADELEELTDARVDEPAEAVDAAITLLPRYGLEAVVVTLGSQGACFVPREGDAFFVPTPPGVEVIDPVGAGDAFASVVITGLLRGWSPGRIVARAHDFAARICRVRGAIPDDTGPYDESRGAWREGQ